MLLRRVLTKTLLTQTLEPLCCRVDRRTARPYRTPDGALRDPDTPKWDVTTPPCRGGAAGDRDQGPRPRPRRAVNLPTVRGFGSQHRSVPGQLARHDLH